MAESVNKEKTRVEGLDYSTGIPASVDIADGHINDISSEVSEKRKNLPFIAPGLFDIQVNGIDGVDFNTFPVSHDDIHAAVRSLYGYGITSFFPTLVTAPANDLREGLRQINSFCKSHPDEGKAIAGIHLEGPFISGDDGPRGAHDKRYISLPDINLLKEWQENCNGMISLVTLAPELQGASTFIAKCSEMGITVSIGHANANSGQIRDAVRAGARLSTHLGNGAHLLLPRHPNYLWDQLAEECLWTSIIADGFHLPDNFMKVVIKVKGDHTILISDSTKYTGMRPGKYQSVIGGSIVLNSEGRLFMAENPKLLAGSAKSLIDCINYLITRNICPSGIAWDMASVNPLNLICPDDIHGLKVGARADLVLFTAENNRFVIKKTFKNGIKVYG